MSSVAELFHTREEAGKGRKLSLYTKDGVKTEHWVLVRGADSDEFRIAETNAKREAMAISQIEDDRERAKAIMARETRCIAALVADWSWAEEEPCTYDNVVAFLTEAPQIADAINSFAGRRALFFREESKNSTSGSKKSSGSKKDQKDQN